MTPPDVGSPGEPGTPEPEHPSVRGLPEDVADGAWADLRAASGVGASPPPAPSYAKIGAETLTTSPAMKGSAMQELREAISKHAEGCFQMGSHGGGVRRILEAKGAVESALLAVERQSQTLQNELSECGRFAAIFGPGGSPPPLTGSRLVRWSFQQIAEENESLRTRAAAELELRRRSQTRAREHDHWLQIATENHEDAEKLLRAENESLRAALERIAEGRGAFSRDQLTFAINVIEDAKATALAALAGLSPRGDAP